MLLTQPRDSFGQREITLGPQAECSLPKGPIFLVLPGKNFHEEISQESGLWVPWGAGRIVAR